jgi:hypothetical protein
VAPESDLSEMRPQGSTECTYVLSVLKLKFNKDFFLARLTVVQLYIPSNFIFTILNYMGRSGAMDIK